MGYQVFCFPWDEQGAWHEWIAHPLHAGGGFLRVSRFVYEFDDGVSFLMGLIWAWVEIASTPCRRHLAFKGDTGTGISGSNIHF